MERHLRVYRQLRALLSPDAPFPSEFNFRTPGIWRCLFSRRWPFMTFTATNTRTRFARSSDFGRPLILSCVFGQQCSPQRNVSIEATRHHTTNCLENNNILTIAIEPTTNAVVINIGARFYIFFKKHQKRWKLESEEALAPVWDRRVQVIASDLQGGAIR
jgi:hypothetical protein